MLRRDFLPILGLGALGGCARRVIAPPALATRGFTVAPVRAEADRIFRITVCLRPFRAAGPRIEMEKVGEKAVVHNYGHGGSGWSLSWGSSRMAADLALRTGEREIAVIGCGALGLTSALLLQQAGARVTIYAKERPADTRSARATGSWTPDSRVALTKNAPADFGARWEQMTRFSFARYQNFLGFAGTPVEWSDFYQLADGTQQRNEDPIGFARYRDRVPDLSPHWHELGAHPFPTRSARRATTLKFNVAALSHQLTTDFLLEGGRIEPAEFHTPGDLMRLPQKTLVNATGYGARALWKDDSLVPVRGQIAWLIPQTEINYSVMHQGVLMHGRRDGIVIQDVGMGEGEGYNDGNEQPDRAAAEKAIGVIRDLYRRMAAASS